MTSLGRLLMKHNAVRYGNEVRFIGRCSKMSIPEFLGWARTVEFGVKMMDHKPELVLKHCDTDEIVDRHFPFVPATRVVWAVQTSDGWREIQESNVIQFPCKAVQGRPCDSE